MDKAPGHVERSADRPSNSNNNNRRASSGAADSGKTTSSHSASDGKALNHNATPSKSPNHTVVDKAAAEKTSSAADAERSSSKLSVLVVCR